MKRDAFTMIELVFVIVVLGILAAIAIPKFAASRTDAIIAKGRSDVSSIRSAIINERQNRLIRGQTGFISRLDQGVNSDEEDVVIFDDNSTEGKNPLLMYGVKTKDADGHWMKTGDNQYSYKIGSQTCTFVYTPTNGKFDLNSASKDIDVCKKLVN